MSQEKTEVLYYPTTTEKNIKLKPTQEINERFNFRLFFAAVSVNLLAFASGTSYGWSSPILPDLESNDTEINPLGQAVTSMEGSWIVSIINIGAAFGTITSGLTAKRIGKKNTILVFGVPLLVSHLILMFANTVGQFLVARFLMGLATGCNNSIVPLYVAEISETRIRGLLGCLLGVLYAGGLIYVFVIGAFVQLKALSVSLSLVPVSLFVLCGYFCPKSPYYYLSNGDDVSAKRSLKKLRNSNSTSLVKELADIKATLQEASTSQSLTEALKTKKFRKAIFITLSLVYFQQFVGNLAITGYMENIFSVARLSISSAVCSIIFAVVTLCSNILSLFLVDIWGRKILFTISSLGCSLCLILLGGFFYMENAGMDIDHLRWLPLFSLIAYTITFNVGLGPLPWTLNGELFANNTKQLASATLCFINYWLAFIITLIFPIFNDLVGLHGSFWFYALNSLACMIFILCCVPETKGKSFQEILTLLEK